MDVTPGSTTGAASISLERVGKRYPDGTEAVRELSLEALAEAMEVVDAECTGGTISDNPAMVKAFVRATQKGMQDAFANPKEAGIILNKYQKQISPEVGEGETRLVGELAIVPGHKITVTDSETLGGAD